MPNNDQDPLPPKDYESPPPPPPVVGAGPKKAQSALPQVKKEEAVKKPIKIKRAKISLSRSQKLISELEKKLGSRVICYYTAHGSTIHQSHPDIFFDHLNKIGPQETLSLLLISNGGSGTASLRIANIFREYCQQLQVIVPSRCASAGTILALSANKVVMSPAGYLTAIDASLRHPLNPGEANRKPISVSVDQVKRVLSFLNKEGPATTESGQTEGSYRTLFKYLHPLALGEIDRASSSSELIAGKMMKMHPSDFGDDQEKINHIADHLVNGYPTHGFPILYQEAKEIGLPVEKADKELSNLLWDITKLYDANTRRTVTDISPTFYHVEGFPIIIESTWRRTAHHYSYNQRFNPTLKSWRTENDNTRWVHVSLSKTKKGLVDLIPIDEPQVEEVEIKQATAKEAPPEPATPSPNR